MLTLVTPLSLMLILPPPNLLLVSIIGVIVALRWPRPGLAITGVALLGLVALATPITAGNLIVLLENGLPFAFADNAPPTAMVILAGDVAKKVTERLETDVGPLTLEELLRWFGESFDILFSAVDQHQLVNPWHRCSQIIASLDYAKQDDVRERVWGERWDLVIIDEAHKCSAYTKSSTGRGDEAEKTKRYQLAERLAATRTTCLLLTATPHHGDDDRFAHFIRLIDSDLFPEPHLRL